MQPWPRSFWASFVFVLGFWGGLVPAQAQIDELPRPDSAHTASFGVSVALGDSIAVVGASGEEGCGENSGAVYVYERESRPQFDEWRLSARLTPRPCRPSAFFGERVALSGTRLLVSASGDHRPDEETNAAYLFERDTTGRWEQTTRFTGDPGRQEGLYAADVDLDGDRAVVSTSGSVKGSYGGAAYVYDYDPETETWDQTARLTASRGVDAGVMGLSVALDGSRLAVAASTYFSREPGSVYVFRHDPNSNRWHEAALLRGIDAFFIDLDLSDPNLIVGEERGGEKGAGRATLYTERADHTWERVARLRPSVPYESGGFGAAVSLEGPWALVTGYDEQLKKEVNIDRVVYVFRRRDERTWEQRTILDIGEIDFGADLDQNGSTALVSSVPDNNPGSVYVVQLH